MPPRGMYLAAKAMDTTRPVLDTSDYSHRVPGADVYDSHDYTQDPDAFAQRHAGTSEGNPYVNTGCNRQGDTSDWSVPYNGQPYFVGEFGSIWWNPDVKEGKDSWGYGDRPTSLTEFYDHVERLCDILLDDVNMFGYCYTQLTDIYQEHNGIYKYDRGVEFDYGAHSQGAAETRRYRTVRVVRVIGKGRGHPDTRSFRSAQSDYLRSLTRL